MTAEPQLPGPDTGNGSQGFRKGARSLSVEHIQCGANQGATAWLCWGTSWRACEARGPPRAPDPPPQGAADPLIT